MIIVTIIIIIVYFFVFFFFNWLVARTYPKNEDIHQDLKCEIFTRLEAFIFKASYREWYDLTIPCRSKMPHISLEQID